MDRTEMRALIAGSVPEPGGTWADLGAGTGNFTFALAELLGPDATIYAIDHDASAIRRLRERTDRPVHAATIVPLVGDFTLPLDLPPLDGLLMANVLHFMRDQKAVLTHAVRALRPGGRLVLVEYEVVHPRPWVPFPVPLARFRALAEAAGLSAPTLIGTRRSPSSGIVMYAGAAVRQTIPRT